MTNKRIAIVYLTFYDKPHYIDEALMSVVNSSYPKELMKLIIVDNSSHGASACYLREKVLPQFEKSLPSIVFVENDSNKGFAGGNNQGIEYALKNEFDYVYLLNNDAKFDGDAVSRAVEMSELDGKIGSVQSLMLLWNEPDLINSSGNDIHYLGFGLTRDYKKPISSITRKDGDEIGYASGAAVLYRCSALRQIGFLDEFLWLYHEDLELGWRLRLAGWKNVLAKSSIVYHDYNFSRSAEKMFWMERNRHIVNLTHMSVSTILILFPVSILMEFVVLGGAFLGGWHKEKLKSYIALISPVTISHILKKRKEIQSLRAVSDKQIAKCFVSKIEHQETDNFIARLVINPLLNLYWSLIADL
jgi:GT2 family glycosyltransferase